MKKSLHPLVDAINHVCAEEGVSRKGLVVFPPKAANVSRERGHGPAEGYFSAQVVPIYTYKVPCDVPELLRGGNHVNPLVQ